MRNISKIITVLAAVLLSGAAFPQEGQKLTGTWGGWVDFLGIEFWFQLRCEGDVVLMDDFYADVGVQTARDVEVNDGVVQFVYEAGIGPITFTGDMDGRILSGELRCEGRPPGRFTLTRFFDMPPDQADAHYGRYETEEGRVLWVVPRTFGGIRIVEHKGDGRSYSEYWFDAWLPWKDDAYFLAPEDGPGLPPERTLLFDGDRFEMLGGETITARRTPGAGVRRVEFRSGELTLHGWLMVPPGEGPHPAIAYGHGSGYVSADQFFDLYTTVRMVRHLGVAVLRWDKRGVWKSGGDQGHASYHDLADDILAAFEWLREQPEVDRNRVGIGGVSQAPSWPIPIAASRSKDIGFIVATSGSTTTIADTNVFNWTNKLRGEGFPEDQVLEAKAFYEGAFPHTVDTEPGAQTRLEAFVSRFGNERWFERAVALGGFQTPLDSPRVDRWRRIWNVDPIEYWAKVTCPVFQAWGADDPLVDAARSSARMAELITRTGQENFTSIVYPSPGDHAVGTANTPTYFDDLAMWFRSAVGSGR